MSESGKCETARARRSALVCGARTACNGHGQVDRTDTHIAYARKQPSRRVRLPSVYIPIKECKALRRARESKVSLAISGPQLRTRQHLRQADLSTPVNKVEMPVGKIQQSRHF